jgi:hypothetical protein
MCCGAYIFPLISASSTRASSVTSSHSNQQKLSERNIKREVEEDEDDILTQYAAAASAEDPPELAAPPARAPTKPWLSSETKTTKKSKVNDPGAKAAVKILDPLAQQSSFPLPASSQSVAVGSTNLSSFSQRKVSSSGGPGGFLAGGALSAASPLPPHAQQALAQSSFGARYSRNDTSAVREPTTSSQVPQDSSRPDLSHLRNFLPLAPSQPDYVSSQPPALPQRSHPQANGARQPTALGSSADGFASSGPAVPPLSLRPSISSGRSYSGGLADSGLSLGRGRGNPDEKRSVTAALPRVEMVQARSSSSRNDIVDRTSRNNAIMSTLRLSEEQKQIVQTALQGRSFFFTGAAGTGKSHVLKELVRVLKDAYDPSSVFVTAPTGVRSVCLFLSHFRLHCSIASEQDAFVQPSYFQCFPLVPTLFTHQSTCRLVLWASENSVLQCVPCGSYFRLALSTFTVKITFYFEFSSLA